MELTKVRGAFDSPLGRLPRRLMGWLLSSMKPMHEKLRALLRVCRFVLFEKHPPPGAPHRAPASPRVCAPLAGSLQVPYRQVPDAGNIPDKSGDR